LDGGRVGEILMPNAYLERGVRVGDQVNVFVYLDQEERLVATTESPLARVGDFAWLRVAWVNEYGAFLDWGLMKDLFVPFREQKMRMEKDRYYLVYIYIDEDTRRIVGTAKVERWLQPAPAAEYHRGRQVELLVQQKTELGFKVIVDNAYSGLVYRDQVFEEPHAGDRLTGSVVNVRPDGKLDVSLQRLGKQRFQDFAEVLLEELQTAGGFLPYTDKSDSSEIAERFGVSKKTFKRAVGTLYKNRNIVLEEKGIRLSSM
jgi:predicted RNA-binding protein (virulence factor B family)